ncbi:unnamed protein product [marine sediment metagenome]|uniref:Uncharacterized protein n=1 Tax=marine sediment metagenome TaxID=412755 RepID=X1B984_9ZZZZ
MTELIITDNSAETLKIRFDLERYVLIRKDKLFAMPEWRSITTTILNPREAGAVRNFIDKCEKERGNN